MKTRISWVIAVMLCFTLSNAWAEEKKKTIAKPAMVRKKSQEQLVQTVGSQQQLPEGVGRKKSRPGDDVAGKNNQSMGSQAGYNVIKAGGNTAGTQSSNKKTPEGGKFWERGGQTKAGQPGSVNDLGREAQLKQLIDPKARLGLPAQGGPYDTRNRSADLARFGVGSGNIEATRGSVSRSDGKNTVSKQGKLSAEGDRPFTGTAQHRPDARDKYSPDSNPGMMAEMKRRSEAMQASGGGGDSPGTIKSEVSYVSKAWAWIEHQTGADKRKFEQPIHSAHGPRGKPAPDGGDVDESHLPIGLRGIKKSKSMAEVQTTERKRQVSLTDENKRQLKPANIEVTNQDIVNKRTDGRITPVDGDGTTTGSATTGGDIIVGPRTINNPTGKKIIGPFTDTVDVGIGDPPVGGDEEEE